MNDSYKEKLDQVVKRFEEVESLLADPKVATNPKKLSQLGKEHADLRNLVNIYRNYQKAEAELADLGTMEDAGDDEEMRLMMEEEQRELEATLKRLEDEIEIGLLPKDPDADRNLIMEIRAGTGGEEAALFAAQLMQMYTQYAENQGWKVEILSTNATGIGGVKEVTMAIVGTGAYGKLQYESGVHRVQRVPKTEASGRIHTSAVTVAVLPEAEEADLELKDEDIEVFICRAGGPGGQGVNTTDSAVRLKHLPSGIMVQCQDERSQIKNKAKAMRVLRSRVMEMEKQAQQQERSAARKDQIGSGDRSEKIRTYNFPQSRITDHRIGFNTGRLTEVLSGEIDPLITALQNEDRLRKIAASGG